MFFNKYKIERITDKVKMIKNIPLKKNQCLRKANQKNSISESQQKLIAAPQEKVPLSRMSTINIQQISYFMLYKTCLQQVKPASFVHMRDTKL